MHVAVIVLGDVGRSPRMQYHALSLLQEGFDVSLVGYEGEDLIPDLANYNNNSNNNNSNSNSNHDASSNNQQLHLVRFTPTSAISSGLRKSLPPLYFAWRLVSLMAALVWALWMRVSRRPVDCVLVQNPPAIPLLLVAYVYCQWLGLLYGAAQRPQLVIDWHNLGYSMLLRPNSTWIQQLAKSYEHFMAPLADGHFCVTKAMKEFLVNDMKLTNVSVLYDCPPSMFQPLAMEEQHAFLQRLQQEQQSLRNECKWIKELSSTETLLTEEMENGTIAPRPNRPVLVTSSTSWTDDEDFGILLDALVTLDHQLLAVAMEEKPSFRMLVLVTGKGPMKEYYQQRISKLTMQHVEIHTLWLTPADYPRLLACADVGISLHTSTSGLDLPMKVLDLFGCETPVCAINFDCLDELVQDKVNGCVFDSSSALASQLNHLFSTFSSDKGVANHSYGDLATYSANLQGRPRWSENWKAHALPLLGR